MKLIAAGISRFHFWGTYSQSFALRFASPEDAVLALPVLNQLKLSHPGTDASGFPTLPGRWSQPAPDKPFLSIFASGDDVDEVVTQLVALGAHPKKISSLQFSCDHGEPFNISVNVDDPKQAELSLS